MRLVRWLGLVGMMVLATGCGDGAGTTDGGSAEAAVDGGLDSGDATLDGGGTDAGGDGGPACAPWRVQVAGTAETDALADAPARCGQAAFAWRRDATLGDPTDVGDEARFTPAQLRAFVSAAGAELPFEVRETVGLRTLRYVTQDRGSLLESTALAAYPVEGAGRQLPVLLLLHGTSGFTSGCGVSDETATRVLAALLASQGIVVVAPDYLGLEPDEMAYGGRLHPYLVGQATAIASLDAVRAVGKLDPSARGGACTSTDLLVFGGSQGGHAALWVDRLAAYYAREVRLLGTVATVPPADLVGQAERALLDVVDATDNIAAFYTTASGWYGVGDRLGEVFVAPWDTQLPMALGASCGWSGLPSPTSTDEVFQATLIEAAREDTFSMRSPWGCMVADNGLTTTSVARLGPTDPGYGVLFVTGELDPLVHTPIEREAFRTLCEQGMPVRYLECRGANHGGGTGWALPEILDFLENRRGGEPFERPASCEPPPPVVCRGTPPDAM